MSALGLSEPLHESRLVEEQIDAAVRAGVAARDRSDQPHLNRTVADQVRHPWKTATAKRRSIHLARDRGQRGSA